MLDSCLAVLEEANERGERVVSHALAARLAPQVPGVCPGLALTDAIDLVFREQGRLMEGGSSAAHPSLVLADRHARLSKEEAQHLTSEIRTSLSTRGQTCLRLHEAHERQAWHVLGYATWSAYVKHEFNLSRRRAYELLDQARAIRSIQDAAGISGTPHISAYWAVKLRSRLPEICAAVRCAVEQADAHDNCERTRIARAVVVGVWREHETNKDGSHPERTDVRGGTTAGLTGAIECLSSQPPVEGTQFQELMAAGLTIQRVRAAGRWLADLERALDPLTSGRGSRGRVRNSAHLRHAGPATRRDPAVLTGLAD